MNSLVSLVPAVQELWDTWEIHCLILVSLFLQVFLFLFAGMRRRSASRILSIVLWLAYLSADSVAIFVLGHLAVRAGEPGHQLMSFWAPFVLVHLGGQDTITAFSKQDNELWMRHLLNLVTQVIVAGYVVAKASWPDYRLKAAMVLMFLSGCFKYAERTGCLYFASPARLGSGIMGRFSSTLLELQNSQKSNSDGRVGYPHVNSNPRDFFADRMLKGDSGYSNDIMSVDAPFNDTEVINLHYLEHPEGIFQEFLSNPEHYEPYKVVEGCLVHWYKRLYTKTLLRLIFYAIYLEFFNSLPDTCGSMSVDCFFIIFLFITFIITPMILYSLFQYVSTPIALMLFAAAEKGARLHTSRADIAVTYILLVGGTILDVSSTIILIYPCVTFYLPDVVANYIQPAWTKKQWSEDLAQYNMIKRYAVQDTPAGMAAIRQWISKLLGSWSFELFDVTQKPINDDDAPIKEFILENLLHSGRRKEWNIASSRGQLAVQRWRKSHPDSATTGKALEKIITSGVDFPITVLILHIATDICYFWKDGASTSSSDAQLKKHKQMSRELSNYIMYLVFKCGVLLTTSSKLLHENAHKEISKCLEDPQGQQVSLGEKAAVLKLFNAVKEEEQQHQMTVDIQKHDEEPADNSNNNTGDSHMRKLLQSAEATTLPVVPRACLVAKELISIKDEAERWGLIAEVWSEMLYYTAPRCGCAFHYEHLSTGGEFITHVLLLMKFLGPFLPPPGA